MSLPQPLSPTAISTLAIDLRLACMRISRRVRFESANQIAPHQFSVLCRLQDAPRTPRELADEECVSAPSMTRTVNALAEQGFVERTPDPSDGRQILVHLTDTGASTLKAIRKRRDQWMVTRVRALSPEEQAVLREASAILSRVAQQ